MYYTINMKITIITLFPDMFAGFLNESIVKRAQEKGALEIEMVQLRDYAEDKHKTLDDRPYGGGAGMLLMAEPVVKAIRNHRIDGSKVLLTSPRGARYSQSKARELSELDHLVIVATRYEGVDERIMKDVDEEVSIGDFVLSGGELAAGVIVDSIARLLPGVLKKEDAAEIESFYTVSVADLRDAVGADDVLDDLESAGVSQVELLEYPHYTRPQEFEGQEVPEVILNGNHAEIKKWQLQQSFEITKERRPDLLRKNS